MKLLVAIFGDIIRIVALTALTILFTWLFLMVAYSFIVGVPIFIYTLFTDMEGPTGYYLITSWGDTLMTNPYIFWPVTFLAGVSAFIWNDDLFFPDTKELLKK